MGRALDASALAIVVIVVVLLVHLLAHLLEGGAVYVGNLRLGEVDGGLGGGGEDLHKVGDLTVLKALGEDNVELNDEVAALAGAALNGHALADDALDVAGLDHSAGGGLNDELAAVELLDDDLEAAEGLAEGEALLHAEVVALALEDGVLLLLEDDDDGAGDINVGVLVALAHEGDLAVVLHTALDLDLEGHLAGNDALGVAGLALVLGVDLTAGAVAGGALHLLLGDHIAHLAHHHAGALTLAVAADGADAGLGGAAALAAGADDVLLAGDLNGLTIVEVLERDGVGDTDIATLASARGTSAAHTAAHAAHHRREHLVHITATKLHCC